MARGAPGRANPLISEGTRLVVISNRLPIVIENEGGRTSIKPGQGGLVTALSPVFRQVGGLWIGWSGAVIEDHLELDDLLRDASAKAGFELRTVDLSAREREEFYHGFSNEIIWPLFHELYTLCKFDPAYWETYQVVNRKFAEVVAANIEENDYVWVHDYHLLNVAGDLHEMGIDCRLAFFLHIPFPPIDIFLKLPWRTQVLRRMLEFDVIGFQTPRDRRNFAECVRTLLPDVRTQGRGRVMTMRSGERTIRVGSFPISIDFNEFAGQAASPPVTEHVQHLREEYGDCKIVLSVDRLDYTKGIPSRLRAIRSALRRYPELHRKVVFVQIVVPSRSSIPGYQELKLEIDRLVGEINGEFTRSAWVPVHHMYRSLQRDELTAYYRTADVGLVTPLRDGMNLVAKEYCTCSIETDGVLILSEFAGAAAEFQRGALLVNPFDRHGVADALHRALTMPPGERRERMRRLRRIVRDNDIFHWVDSFLVASDPRKSDHSLKPVEEFVPGRDSR